MATKKKSKGKKKSKKGFGGIDFMKYIGIAGGIFGSEKGLEQITAFTNLDAKAQAGIKIAIGEFAPRFVKPYAKGNDAIVDGAADSFKVLGMKELMAEFGIAGIGEDVMGKDIYVDLSGIDDTTPDDDDDDMGEDVMGEDDDLGVVNADDLDVVNDDDDDESGEYY